MSQHYEGGMILLYTLVLSLLLWLGISVVAVDFYRQQLLTELRWQREIADNKINRQFIDSFRSLQIALEPHDIEFICTKNRLPVTVNSVLSRFESSVEFRCDGDDVILDISFEIETYRYTERWSLSYE